MQWLSDGLLRYVPRIQFPHVQIFIRPQFRLSSCDMSVCKLQLNLHFSCLQKKNELISWTLYTLTQSKQCKKGLFEILGRNVCSKLDTYLHDKFLNHKYFYVNIYLIAKSASTCMPSQVAILSSDRQTNKNKIHGNDIVNIRFVKSSCSSKRTLDCNLARRE